MLNWLKEVFLKKENKKNIILLWIDRAWWEDFTCKIYWEIKDWYLIINYIKYD